MVWILMPTLFPPPLSPPLSTAECFPIECDIDDCFGKGDVIGKRIYDIVRGFCG